jgi:hypothetical protein
MMKLPSTIQHFRHTEIDKAKWDECIQSCAFGLIYARSFYLDNMAAGWNALIGEDYGWVFPLTSKKKYGVTYLYQPPFCQQLGVFTKPSVEVPFTKIFEWLKNNFSFWEINLNHSTDSNSITLPVEFNTATNFILNLAEDYTSIASRYKNDLTKNIDRSKKLELKFQRHNDYNKVIDLFMKYYSGRLSNISLADYQRFRNICAYAKEEKTLLCREVVSSSNELMSIALILIEGKRLYNLMNVTTAAGRRVEANHFLLDSIIKEHSGKELIFDFEGSDVPGIKSFYRGFGAENQPYYPIKYNNLPWPWKWLKR